MLMPRIVLLATALLFFLPALPAEELRNATGPIALRGFGRVQVKSEGKRTPHGLLTHAVFTAESHEKAIIVGSKYLADLQSYGAVSKSDIPEATLKIRHSGYWKLGRVENRVHLITAPDAAGLKEAIRLWQADNWKAIPQQAYPRWLDNFDNSALAFWWMPSTKSAEQMDWMAAHPVVANLHDQRLSQAIAPDVLDTSGPEHAAAQLRQLGRPFRTMLWTGNGKQTWFSWMNLPTQEFEGYPEGFTGLDYFEANGYYTNQCASTLLDNLQLTVLETMMNRWKHDPDLMAWMEPHGEFQLFRPANVPPDWRTTFPAFLREERNYTLGSLSMAWTGSDDRFTDWSQVPLPDDAYFAGRRGNWIDLDDRPWRWRQGELKQGEANGLCRSDCNDSGWFEAMRTSKRLMAYNDKHRNVPTPMWISFRHEVPASFLKPKQKIYLHIMPATKTLRSRKNGTGTELAVWINGQEAGRNLRYPHDASFHEHSQVEISRFLTAGDNQFVIHSQGGRLAYRVFLSPHSREVFPFQDRHLNQRYLDWRDYLRHRKLQTLKIYLKAMRSIDPNRPIKVMTPQQWLSDAMDLFEQYGAYPQLTGETTWYRPMHYKGYTSLRGRLSSSEPGSYLKTADKCRQMFANIFMESQDCHDYGFDFSRDFWRYPETVKWWEENRALLATFGKTNLSPCGLGLLRDTEQSFRYKRSDIWSWDLSRGPLPALGLTPMLVDGQDLRKGLAKQRVKVMLDCATVVTPPDLVAAIEDYVNDGGIFIAQFNTGQHSEQKKDTWPLAAAFGLRVQPHPKMSDLTFSAEQDLLPSLRGRTRKSRGMAIDYTGKEYSGAVEVSGQPAEAIARWQDNGQMAIVRVKRGKGAFIFLGTPFHLAMQDQEGVWNNLAERQALLAELLASCGIEQRAVSSHPKVWCDPRTSKNGVYQVFMTSAMGIKRDQKEALTATLRFKGLAEHPVIEASAKGTPDVTSQSEAADLILNKQSFLPYRVRQFAVVRDRAGIEGPIHWLLQQEQAWFAIPAITDPRLAKAKQASAAFAKHLGEAGLDLSKGWKIQIDPTDSAEKLRGTNTASWPTGNLGSWLTLGCPEATRVFYRKTVHLPPDWRKTPARLFLGLSAWREHGIRDQGRLWVNGILLQKKLAKTFLIQLAADVAAKGTLDLALDVTAEKKSTRAYGPVGTLYLRRLPKPVDNIDLKDSWTELKTMMETGYTFSLPVKEKLFGLSRQVEIPASWQGKVIRLVIEEASDHPLSSVRACILNDEGYLREDSFRPVGVRVDRYLKAGQRNRIDLFGHYHDFWAKIKPFSAHITAIRLEAY
jgi:hypothetical protein